MRIIFVGIHYKKGLKALDSQTKTGKLVDRIIAKLPSNIEVNKTNLFNRTELPNKEQFKELSEEWYWTNLPTDNDIIILLGKIVEIAFKHTIDKLIKVHHPASKYNHKAMDEYVSDTVLKIKRYCI